MPIVADIYYHVYEGNEIGRKPPIVLIHGAGGSHLYWPSEVRRLPAQRVYAIDLPGHGKSTGRGHQSISAFCDAVFEWFEAIGLYSAVFVGHSMGSAIAMTAALEKSDHVLGLGLIGAGARLKVSSNLMESTASETTFHNAVETIVSWSFSKNTAEHLTEMAARRMAETRPSVLHSDFHACNGFDLTERVSDIQSPTMIICGEDDKMTPLRSSQFLASKIPDAKLEVIPNAGHMVMLEKPIVVAEALTQFLQEFSY